LILEYIFSDIIIVRKEDAGSFAVPDLDLVIIFNFYKVVQMGEKRMLVVLQCQI